MNIIYTTNKPMSEEELKVMKTNKQLQISKKKPLSYTQAMLISSGPKPSSLKIKDK